MAELTIPGFPDDIDRDAFGHWLAGFTDGEGCFYLNYHKFKRNRIYYTAAKFKIQVRADDRGIMENIGAFFGVGHLYTSYKFSSNITMRINRKPQVVYIVQNIRELKNRVIPVFDSYPLRAKKLRDFLIWKEGVELIHSVTIRRSRPKISARGCYPKWEKSEFEQLKSLSAKLRKTRAYPDDPADFIPATNGHTKPLDMTQGLLAFDD